MKKLLKKLFKKHEIKFLSALLLYAAVVWILIWIDSQRLTAFALLVLNVVFIFGLLWLKLKPRRVLGLMLCGALAAAPIRVQADEPPNDGGDNAVFACVTVIIGGAIVWGLWKLCQKIPTPKPPETNCPPPWVPGTNTNTITNRHHRFPAIRMQNSGIEPVNAWQTMSLAFQSSTDGGATWQEKYSVTNWLCDNAMISVCYSNGVSLQTNAVGMGWTNGEAISDFTEVMPSRFDGDSCLWRAVQN